MIYRILFAILFMSAAFAGHAAQLTAMLQSGETITPFYGADAFVKAHEAAVDGDVITLSPGVFNPTEITKAVKVVGTFAFSDDDSKATRFNNDFTVSCDNVTLEGIRTNNKLIINGANQLTLTRCYISTLSDTEKEDHKYHNNTILTDCLVYYHGAMNYSQNMVIRNCCINYFGGVNSKEYPALIENCNVHLFACSYSWGITESYSQPYAIYRNCYLGFFQYGVNRYSMKFQAPSEFHNNCFAFSSDGTAAEWTIDMGDCQASDNKTMTISDTTTDAKFGSYEAYESAGPADHKEYPAIPEITSSEIDTETDAEGNIHVKISAVAHD